MIKIIHVKKIWVAFDSGQKIVHESSALITFFFSSNVWRNSFDNVTLIVGTTNTDITFYVVNVCYTNQSVLFLPQNRQSPTSWWFSAMHLWDDDKSSMYSKMTIKSLRSPAALTYFNSAKGSSTVTRCPARRGLGQWSLKIHELVSIRGTKTM